MSLDMDSENASMMTRQVIIYRLENERACLGGSGSSTLFSELSDDNLQLLQFLKGARSINAKLLLHGSLSYKLTNLMQELKGPFFS